ncbi:MAG: hypothetical protein AB8B87_10930 [Granulosicoccus sp.]
MSFFTATNAGIDRDELALFNIKCRLFFCLPLVMIVLTQGAAAYWRWLFKRYYVAHIARIPQVGAAPVSNLYLASICFGGPF